MSSSVATHPVTVVVPVYGDLMSLTACVESLRQNIDQSLHRVLLVNDNGPDADEIEAALVDMIADDAGFFYERNRQNLGFVGNCNRAVFELDTTDNDILLLNSDTVTTPGFVEELSAVLHSSPSHGAVCPRSNNATIASLPFKLRDPSSGRDVDRTAKVHATLRGTLPRFSISPVAMGFCILIRRELIREYGLFDEIFAPGYGEENDFCLRVREHGFVSVIAHRALVFHVGGLSFVGARREALRSAHEKLLVARYPFYTDAVRAYINQERDPVDVFADAMVPGDDIIRVLIDLETDGRSSDGWNHEVLTAASALESLPGARFTVSVPDRQAAKLAKRFPTLRVVRQSRLDGQWDVAVARAESLSPPQLARLNRTSLRWVLAGPQTSAFADTTIDEQDGAGLIHEVVAAWGRSPIDVSRLRSRWSALTAVPDYQSGASTPLESRRIRLLRRAEGIAPRPVGWAKGVAKKVLGKN